MINGNYTVDPIFRDFLDFMKQKYGMIQSRIITLAVIEKYQDEYAEFMKTYGKEADGNA